VIRVLFFTVEEKKKIKAWAIDLSFVSPFLRVDKNHPVIGYSWAFVCVSFNLVFTYLLYSPYICLAILFGGTIILLVAFGFADLFHWLLSFFQ
jgi:hypothetical protein